MVCGSVVVEEEDEEDDEDVWESSYVQVRSVSFHLFFFFNNLIPLLI